MEDKARFLLETLSLIDQNAGERKDNTELAIAAFRASLELYTRRAFPVEWAETQLNHYALKVHRFPKG